MVPLSPYQIARTPNETSGSAWSGRLYPIRRSSDRRFKETVPSKTEHKQQNNRSIISAGLHKPTSNYPAALDFQTAAPSATATAKTSHEVLTRAKRSETVRKVWVAKSNALWNPLAITLPERDTCELTRTPALRGP